jgi:translation initiation factor 3 subunit D
MNLNLNNGWAIVRTFVDMVLKEPVSDGKFVLVKDPNKPIIRLYQVPKDTFEEEDGDADVSVAPSKVEEDAAEE